LTRFTKNGKEDEEVFFGIGYDCYYGVQSVRLLRQIGGNRQRGQGESDRLFPKGELAADPEGEGVNQDYVEATKWWRKAAKRGFARAQYGLGVSYRNGKGVEQDKIEAARWFQKAARQGLDDAKEALKELDY